MKTLIIAEIGQNWESLEDIKDSIDFVTSLGCIPKLQAWITEDTVSKERSPELYARMKAKELPREWYYKLKLHCPDLFYSVFCESIVDFLESEIQPNWYKIASPDCVNDRLVDRVVETGERVFMSVGGVTDSELFGMMLRYHSDIILLDCIVEYPAKLAYLGNLKKNMEILPHFEWGYSDHTANPLVPALAVSMGATTIESHFKLRSDMTTPDAPHSSDKSRFAEMVKNVRIAEDNIGLVSRPTELEKVNLNIGRRGNDGKRPLV